VVNKRQVNRSLNKLQRIKTWQLLILLILVGFISATFLRLNNIGMLERRKAVISADNAGIENDIQGRLYDLQRYISAHMNTDMGKGVYLEASYKRDVQIVDAKNASASNPNGNIYKKVQDVCVPRFSNWSYAYVQCTVNELAKYPEGDVLINSINRPHADMYLHVFASPAWSPDFAGLSIIIGVVIFIIILARITSVVILKMLLRKHHNSI